MIGRPKGRKGDAQARDDWTERLKKFAAAKNAKQRQAVIDDAFKINPGGTLRDLLNAWGYSPSTRGRKPKTAKKNSGSSKTARQRLEETLHEMFGAKPSPVPSLYTKLSGSASITVKDAIRIVAALIYSWPEPLKIGRAGKVAEEAMDISTELAETFVRELLSELSSGRSLDWSEADMEIRVFKLVAEERVGASQFVREASEVEGALIVAGAKTILLGASPIEIIRDFQNLTREFTKPDTKSILIFVMDTGIFDADEDRFQHLYNLGLLSSAITAFALFQSEVHSDTVVRKNKVDWSEWRAFCSRSCVIMRRPPLIDPETGRLLAREQFDKFIGTWTPANQFEKLPSMDGFPPFESQHVLPRTFPLDFAPEDTVTGKDLYWDIHVRPSTEDPENLTVEYFVLPNQRIQPVISNGHEDQNTKRTSRGRPPANTFPIEEDFSYVVRRDSPGARYDAAQRMIYRAARARLKVDKGQVHEENLNAASALRQIGYEAIPVSIAVSMLPRSLHFAADKKHLDKKRS